MCVTWNVRSEMYEGAQHAGTASEALLLTWSQVSFQAKGRFAVADKITPQNESSGTVTN